MAEGIRDGKRHSLNKAPRPYVHVDKMVVSTAARPIIEALVEMLEVISQGSISENMIVGNGQSRSQYIRALNCSLMSIPILFPFHGISLHLRAAPSFHVLN